MMICHGWYPAFEPAKKPASLSARVINGLLRDELGFKGLVMTDDLDMGAILNEYGLPDTIRLAMEAGNDIAMICHRLQAVAEARVILESMPKAQLDRALAAVHDFKKRLAAAASIFRSDLSFSRPGDLGFAPGRARAGTCCRAQP